MRVNGLLLLFAAGMLLAYLAVRLVPPDLPPEPARALRWTACFAVVAVECVFLLRTHRKLKRLVRLARGAGCLRCRREWGDLPFCARCGAWRPVARALPPG